MKSGALKITLVYIITGLLCIGLGHKIPEAVQNYRTASCIVVLLTGLMLYKLISSQYRRLLEDEKQYRSYFEDSSAPMWVYNRNTLEFVAVNHVARARYGYSREEFSKMNILDIHLTDDAKKVLSVVTGLRHTYKNSGTWVHRKKNGKLIQVCVVSYLITSGQKEHVMVITTDLQKPGS